jgi:hypothetical protein
MKHDCGYFSLLHILCGNYCDCSKGILDEKGKLSTVNLLAPCLVLIKLFKPFNQNEQT